MMLLYMHKRQGQQHNDIFFTRWDVTLFISQFKIILFCKCKQNMRLNLRLILKKNFKYKKCLVSVMNHNKFISNISKHISEKFAGVFNINKPKEDSWWPRGVGRRLGGSGGRGNMYTYGSDGKESACQCKRPRFNPWARKILWRRKWQPTPVFLPGKSHGQRRLAGYSPGGHKESNVTKQLTHSLFIAHSLFFFFLMTVLGLHCCTQAFF